jgi:hypothetical protein
MYMEKENKASRPPIVGDSEGSCISGPNTKGPTPTVGDITEQLRHLSLLVMRLQFAEQERRGVTTKYLILGGIAAALRQLANELKVVSR